MGANPRTSTPPSILSATFQAPSHPVQSMPGDGQGNFFFNGGGFPTLANLNAAFPNGTYSFAFQTITPPTAFNPQMVFTGDNYPAPFQRSSNTEWSSGGLQVDPTQLFTFRSNSFSPFLRTATASWLFRSMMRPTTLSSIARIPRPPYRSTCRQTPFSRDQYYSAAIIFANRITTFLSPRTFTIINYQVATDFKIATIRGSRL